MGETSMQVCVCTVTNHPEDARILHRQIRALLDAGHTVTYIAPFRACHVTPWRGVMAVDVPRATGRRRTAALRTALSAARRLLARYAPVADLVLLHDPELLLAVPRGARHKVVWDVRKDPLMAARGWLPRPVVPLARPYLRYLEATAERRYRLLFADEGNRARFRADHPVVPN